MNQSTPPEPDASGSDAPICPVCESERLVEQQCRLVCRNCGYVESCEDLFGIDDSPDV